MIWPFNRNPGRDLARIGHIRQRQLIRETTDQMRRDLGMKPVKWPRIA